MRVHRLLSLAVALLLAVACSPSAPEQQMDHQTGPPAALSTGPPNIVVIYVDDLGYGDLGSYGHHTIQTPHLDRLAAEGMRFTRYYAPSPLCSPSRAALLTGRTPFRTGIQNWIPENQDVQLGPDEVTLATLLRQQGYATFLGGKWHLNGGLDNQAHTQPQDHGFDHWLALHAFAVPNTRNPVNLFRNGDALGEVEGFAAGITLDETLSWLDRHHGSSDAATTPFFVYLATAEPHGMIASPDEYYVRYSAFTKGTPGPFDNGTPEPPPDLEARGPGEYYANVTYLDDQIGRLLGYLDQHDLSDDTLIFFASDNGPVTSDWRHWWEINLYGDTGGLRGRKADLWDGGVRVPAIVRWPGRVEAGLVSDALLSGYDLLPTLAEIVGFDLPSDRPIDGEDFGTVLRGESWRRDRPLYWQFDDDQGYHYAVRDERYKLLADRELERLTLYDLQADPFEVVDVATKAPETVAALLEQLRWFSDSVERDPLRPASAVTRPGYRGDD